MRLEFVERTALDDDALGCARRPSGDSAGSPTRSSTARCAGSARATARASSGVGLPSMRSPPTGLPVTCRVTEGTHHVVAHLERVAEREPVRAQLREQFVGACSDAASTAPRCSGRSIVYLPGLVPADALGLDESRSRWTEPTMSRNWPMFNSMRSSFQMPDRLDRRSLQQLIGVDEREVADEDRDAFAESARLARPTRRGVIRPPASGVGRRLAAPCRWRRPSRRRGTGRTRASARTPPRRRCRSGRRSPPPAPT